MYITNEPKLIYIFFKNIYIYRNSKDCFLVMEYADGGTLQNYLKEHFGSLTWRDKFNLALQLAYTVSCLHDEGIAHRNLVIHLHDFTSN